MVIAEDHLSLLKQCEARALPNWRAPALCKLSAGTDVKFLRDEDRDFVKVAYDGRPVYVPRQAVMQERRSVVINRPDRLGGQSFALRQDFDLALSAMLLAAAVTVSTGWWTLMQWGRGLVELLMTVALVSASFVLLWIISRRFGRGRKTCVEIYDTVIVLRTFRHWDIQLDDIEKMEERHLRAPDVLRISFDFPLLILPWTEITLTLPPFPSRQMLQITLKKSVNFGWWPLRFRYRRVLFDPEDRAGFLNALQKAAPHVRIDPVLAAECRVVM